MLKSYLPILAVSALMWSCTGASGDDPGTEYAPNMYHSVAYEPLSQSVDPTYGEFYNSTPYNDYKGEKKINMRLPVEGTVKRQNYRTIKNDTVPMSEQTLLVYNIHKDSIDMAGRLLKNPVPLDANGVVLGEGKKLYLQYCSPCHGEQGKGDGKVGAVYKGVPNYTTGRYKTLPEGHIFHTITHGKGRMWAHKGQINPEDRWKIVHYVQQLQKGS